MAKWRAHQKRMWILENVEWLSQWKGVDLENAPHIKGNYMGLDLSISSTGYVVFNEENELIDKGSFGESSYYSHWQQLYRMNKDMRELLDEYEPSLIAYEAVRSQRHFTGLRAMCFANAVFYLNYNRSNEEPESETYDSPLLLPFTPGQIKKHATDDYRADKSEVMKWANNFGLDTDVDDISDAFGAADMARQLIMMAGDIYQIQVGKEFDNKRVREWLKKYQNGFSRPDMAENIISYLEKTTLMKENLKRDYAKTAKKIREE